MSLGPMPRRSPAGTFFPRHSTPRHQPYHVPRLDRRTSQEQSIPPSFINTDHSTSIKQENVEGSNSELAPAPGAELSDADQSNSSSMTMPAENIPGSVQESSEGTNIKQEVTDSELDLEITGVEIGMPVASQENWAGSVAMGMNFDQSGAMGSSADITSQQGYSKCFV